MRSGQNQEHQFSDDEDEDLDVVEDLGDEEDATAHAFATDQTRPISASGSMSGSKPPRPSRPQSAASNLSAASTVQHGRGHSSAQHGARPRAPGSGGTLRPRSAHPSSQNLQEQNLPTHGPAHRPVSASPGVRRPSSAQSISSFPSRPDSAASHVTVSAGSLRPMSAVTVRTESSRPMSAVSNLSVSSRDSEISGEVKHLAADSETLHEQVGAARIQSTRPMSATVARAAPSTVSDFDAARTRPQSASTAGAATVTLKELHAETPSDSQSRSRRPHTATGASRSDNIQAAVQDPDHELPMDLLIHRTERNELRPAHRPTFSRSTERSSTFSASFRSKEARESAAANEKQSRRPRSKSMKDPHFHEKEALKGIFNRESAFDTPEDEATNVDQADREHWFNHERRAELDSAMHGPEVSGPTTDERFKYIRELLKFKSQPLVPEVQKTKHKLVQYESRMQCLRQDLTGHSIKAAAEEVEKCTAEVERLKAWFHEDLSQIRFLEQLIVAFHKKKSAEEHYAGLIRKHADLKEVDKALWKTRAEESELVARINSLLLQTHRNEVEAASKESSGKFLLRMPNGFKSTIRRSGEELEDSTREQLLALKNGSQFTMVSDAWGATHQAQLSQPRVSLETPDTEEHRPLWSGRPKTAEISRWRGRNALRERIRSAQRSSSKLEDVIQKSVACKEQAQFAEAAMQRSQTKAREMVHSGWVLRKEWNEVTSTHDWRRRWAVLDFDFLTLSRLQGGEIVEKHSTQWMNLVTPVEETLLEIGDRYENFALRTRHTEERDRWNAAIRFAIKVRAEGSSKVTNDSQVLLSPAGKRPRG